MKLTEDDWRVQCANALQLAAEGINCSTEAYPENWELKYESNRTSYSYTMIGDITFITGHIGRPYWFAYSRMEVADRNYCAVKITFMTPDPGAIVIDNEFTAPQQAFVEAFAEDMIDNYKEIWNI